VKKLVVDAIGSGPALLKEWLDDGSFKIKKKKGRDSVTVREGSPPQVVDLISPGLRAFALTPESTCLFSGEESSVIGEGVDINEGNNAYQGVHDADAAEGDHLFQSTNSSFSVGEGLELEPSQGLLMCDLISPIYTEGNGDVTPSSIGEVEISSRNRVDLETVDLTADLPKGKVHRAPVIEFLDLTEFMGDSPPYSLGGSFGSPPGGKQLVSPSPSSIKAIDSGVFSQEESFDLSVDLITLQLQPDALKLEESICPSTSSASIDYFRQVFSTPGNTVAKPMRMKVFDMKENAVNTPARIVQPSRDDESEEDNLCEAFTRKVDVGGESSASDSDEEWDESFCSSSLPLQKLMQPLGLNSSKMRLFIDVKKRDLFSTDDRPYTAGLIHRSRHRLSTHEIVEYNYHLNAALTFEEGDNISACAESLLKCLDICDDSYELHKKLFQVSQLLENDSYT
jgi:hypothetical protein